MELLCAKLDSNIEFHRESFGRVATQLNVENNKRYIIKYRGYTTPFANSDEQLMADFETVDIDGID